MYPEIEPYMTGRLQVSPVHSLYFEQSGNPEGQPVIFLHGGPGGGTSPYDRRFFDPSFYRIILLDQRGAGKSTPHANLEDNTTWHLVSDIERLRETLHIDSWVVFGGSWGSTLSLAYAETHPQRVVALLLRGIFTLRREELLYFYQHGTSFIFPDVWEEYLAPIPEEERGDLMNAYYKRLTGSNREEQMRCARAWSKWEMATCKLYMDPDALQRAENDQFALAFARIECHYFVNGGFFEYDGQLLAEVDKIRHIPTTVVQGRYDMVCPMKTAWDLHRALPEAEIIIVDDNGHSAKEPGIAEELVKAADATRDNLIAKGGPPRVSVPQQPAAKPQSQSQSQSQPQRGAAASAPRAPAPSAATGIRRLPDGRIDPSSMPSAGARDVKYPGTHFHQRRDPNLESRSGEDQNIQNALHKKPLQPPGGTTHNIFG